MYLRTQNLNFLLLKEMSSVHALVHKKNDIYLEDPLMDHIVFTLKKSLDVVEGINHSRIFEYGRCVDVLYNQLEIIRVMKVMFINKSFWTTLLPVVESWWKAFDVARKQVLNVAACETVFLLVVDAKPMTPVSDDE